MTLRLVVRPAVEADIPAAALWYEQRAPGLGADFRRALLRRFPYALYFVPLAETVSVIACRHASRDPRRWEERAGRDR